MGRLVELLGDSPGIVAVREQIRQVLAREAQAHRLPPILLQGETGTGKGLLAKLIHRDSSRRDGPFVDVNCAAIPDTLLESELFGFERGAFTDARHPKAGLLQTAHGGTILLDEVGLLPDALQAKLLKAIEERAVRRLGGTRAEPVDVQIIAATNEDLASAVRARRTREDFYHRLAVVTLTLPPLRERHDDILLLAEHFLARTCRDYGLPERRFSADAQAALIAYRWPGNIRELSNVVERAALFAEAPLLTTAILGLPPVSSVDSTEPSPTDQDASFDERTAGMLRESLEATNWNISRAAARLGISRSRLRYRIEKHGLRSGGSVSRRREPRRLSTAASPPIAAAPSTEVAPLFSVRWERRHVGLMRADLVLSPTADSSSDAGRAIAVIAEKVQSFGGQPLELGPTAIVTAFGLEPAENAPHCAALTAMAIQKAADRAQTLDPRSPGVKVAIHAGQMMVGRIQGAWHIDVEGKHEAWSTLATLITLGEASTILISENAVPFLERRFELVRESPAGTPGQVYRLAGRERTGFGLGGRALTRFVGRERELASLGDRLMQVERGHGQVLGVVGEPGVGKSRFVYELTRQDRLRGWRIVSGGLAPYGIATPYSAVTGLLKHYFLIDDAEPPLRIREKVSEHVVMRDRSLEPHVGALLAVLDVPVEDPAWRALDPPQRRQRTFEAVKRLLLRESQAQPLLVVFEDLHWVDSETQAVLDSLVETLGSARLLLLVNYRPEYEHRWGNKTAYSQIRLDSLPAESAAELLAAILGPDPGLAPLTQRLVKRGNPFFLEETVRTLVETGALAGQRGAYRLTRPVEALQVPATVQAILAARIDRLPAEEKQLLQAASVIGKDVPSALLAAIADRPAETLRRGLAHLQEAEFLFETRLSPDLEYTFKHALTHEVTYGSLLQDRRRQLHAQIVAAIERLYPDRLSEQVERLAHHALRGHLWDKAVGYSRQAGSRAFERSALREARAHFDQARAALRELPESRERTEQLIDLCFEQRNALYPLGEFERLGEVQGEARALAEGLGDQRRLGWALGYLAVHYSVLGEHARAIDAGESACAIAEAVGDLALRVVANYYLGQALWWSGDPRRAADALRPTIALVKDAPLGERFGLSAPPAVLARFLLAIVLAELGEFAEAVAAGQEALRIAQAASHPFGEVWARYGLGYAHLRHGDFAAATRVLEQGLALCRRMEIRFALPHVAASLGCAYVWSGRAADAVPLLEEAVEAFTAMRILGLRSLFTTLRAEAYLVLGRIAEAREQAEQAVMLARTYQERGWEIWGLKLFGDAHTHEPAEAEEARDTYRQALALATELGVRPLVAHCHLGLGKVSRQTGKRDLAQEHLTTATTMYREMDMTFWVERAEAEMAEAE